MIMIKERAREFEGARGGGADVCEDGDGEWGVGGARSVMACLGTCLVDP